MIQDIKKYLESKDLYFWSITKVDVEREEIYIIRKGLESKREVYKDSYNISVYTKQNGKIGSSSISFPSLDMKDIEREIDRAIDGSSSVLNEDYNIDQDIFDYRDIEEQNFDIEKVASKVRSYNEVSSSELFFTKNRVEYLNSKGNRSLKTLTNITFELVVMDGHHEFYTLVRSNPASFDVDKIMENSINYLNSFKGVEMPKTGKYSIAFSENCLDDFFEYFVYNSLGSTIYNKISNFKVGERVGPKELTMYSDPSIEGFELDHDGEGYPYERFTIIENGVLKNIVSSNRYAQYLNSTYTGALSNLVIKSGDKSKEELLKNSLQIVKVSNFIADEVTGSFSSEIRLAYLRENGKIVKTIRGGAVAGNIRDFDSIELSKERVLRPGYIGPEIVLLNNVNIAGE